MLQIADNLQLPPEAMTLTSAILGIRGSGKTNTGVVFTEELLDQGQQVIVIDPLDVWFGLKSSADGKSPGFAVVVLGGAFVSPRAEVITGENRDSHRLLFSTAFWPD